MAIEQDSVFKAPPRNLEMEQAVLGAMLIERWGVERAVEILRAEDFSMPAHRVIYEALLNLHEKIPPGKDLDVFLVQEELQRLDLIDNVGGAPYLLQLTHAVPAVANVEHYASAVQEKAIRRRLITFSSELDDLCHNESNDVGDMLYKAEKAFGVLLEQQGGGSGILKGMVGANRLPQRKVVDDLWFSLYPGKSHLFVGESGAGKSSVLYNVALHAARNERLWGFLFGLGRPARVLYVDPENAGSYREELFADMDGGLCWQKMQNILGPSEVPPPTLFFQDGDGMNLSLPAHRKNLERAIKRGVDGQPFDLVILDPIVTLFRIEDENSNAELARVSEQIRQLSRKTGACVIASHHTGKPGGNSSGVLSGRGASALVGAMDVVITWRARRGNDEEEDDEYTGVQRIRKDVCRWCIEKDRPGQFATGSSIYLRMGSPRLDCFEKVQKKEWTDAGKAGGDSRAKASDRAQAILRTLLEDGEWVARDQIVKQLSRKGVGRNSADEALTAMEKIEEIERCHMGTSALFYRIAQKGVSAENMPGNPGNPGNPPSQAESIGLPETDQSRGFPGFPGFPDEVNDEAGRETPDLPHLKGFFTEDPPKPMGFGDD